MRYVNIKAQLFIFVLLLPMANLHAGDFRGRIVKTQGDVFIVNAQGEQRVPEKSKFLVNVNETVITGSGGKAVVQFDDGALSVVNERSKIKVEKSGWLSHLSGKIYYLFRKVSGKEKSRKIKTGFTTIGIRGTTFIVYDDGDQQGVALQEGSLNLETLDKPYEIHKAKSEDDFAAFKQQMQAKDEALKLEYNEYKDKLSKDFVEYKNSFDLQPNRVISFNGHRVDEKEISDTIKDEFDDFTRYAQDYIGAFKELEAEMMK